MTRTTITKACLHCAAEFVTEPSKRQRFCSRTCARRFDPTPVNKGRNLDAATFWSRVTRGDGCWEWQGAITSTGYGHVSVDGVLVVAHRHAWTLERGPIPAGKFVLHHCDNRRCVRVDHLYLGSLKDNAADRERRGRSYWQKRRQANG